MIKRPYLFIVITLLLLITNFQIFSNESNSVQLLQQADSIAEIDIDSLFRVIINEQNKSPEQALSDSRRIIHLAMNGHNKDLISQAYYQTAEAFYNLGNFDSSYYYCEKLLKSPSLKHNIQAHVYNRLCIIERKLGNYDDALQSGQKAIKEFERLHDSISMVEATMNLSKVYTKTGDLKLAMKQYFSVLRFFEEKKDTLKQGQVLGSIANVYMDMDQVQRSKQYFALCLEKLRYFPANYLYGDALNNLGTIMYEEKKYDSALLYFERAKRVYQKAQKVDAVAASYENIGVTQVYLNDVDEGFKNLHIAGKTFDYLHLKRDKVNVLLDMGQAFIEVGLLDSAKLYLLSGLKLSTDIGYTYGEKLSLLKLYDSNHKDGNFEKALYWFKKYVALKKNLDSKDLKENLQELEVKYQTVKREKKIIELKDRELIEKANSRFLNMVILTIIILAFLLALILWLKRKKDLQIHHQKLLVVEKEKALAEAKVNEHQLHESQLENEIEFKTKQLASHALNMLQKNKMLQDISTSISDKMKSSDEKGKTNLINIKKELQQGLNVEKDWDLFKLYFEQINEKFFINLRNINPRLTSNDFRLCALIKLNMSVKEMAAVLNISTDSLKNARYRLKKKLDLKSDDNLNNFINGVCCSD